MSMITNEYYENEANQQKAMHIQWEIADCLHHYGKLPSEGFPIIPYLLNKVSQYNFPFGITLKSILNGEIGVSDDARYMAGKVLTEEMWERLLQLVTKYSPEEFALATVMPVPDGEPRGTMTTPPSILKLVNKLLDVKAGERVADVCCGSGNYMVSAALEENGASYHGYEVNSENFASAQMRSELIDADMEVTLCDVFSLAENETMPEFDKIFAGYPFGLQMRNLGAGTAYLEQLETEYPGLSKATSSDWVFNALICDLLHKDGKAIGIMTNGSTWNRSDLAMRKYFVERKMVESVISLPGRMFASTSIPTTLIVLSHDNDTVRMIDATKHYQQGRRQNEFSDENITTIIESINSDCDSDFSKSVSLDELRACEYNLSLSRYAAEELSFQDGVNFASVIKSISRGAPCTASQLDKMVSDSATDMQYLMLANIKNGLIDDKLPYLSYIDPKYDKYCLKNNSLILSKNGYPYKVAVASVTEGQRILANGNLYIIELDESKANPLYIKAFFESEQGDAVLKSITVGATIPNIGVEMLKNVMIPLPSMEEQERIADKYRAALEEVVVLKQRLNEAVEKLNHILDEE